MRKDDLKIILPITGMACSSCAAHFENVINEIPGVEILKVNLVTETAELIFSNGNVETGLLVEAVKHAGFDIPTESITLGVGGMTCVSCAAHVEGALSEVPGVVSANVNLVTDSVSVKYIPEWIDLTNLTNAVVEIGYSVLDNEYHTTVGDAEEDIDQVVGKMRESRIWMKIAFGFIILIILWMFTAMIFGIV